MVALFFSIPRSILLLLRWLQCKHKNETCMHSDSDPSFTAHEQRVLKYTTHHQSKLTYVLALESVAAQW